MSQNLIRNDYKDLVKKGFFCRYSYDVNFSGQEKHSSTDSILTLIMRTVGNLNLIAGTWSRLLMVFETYRHLPLQGVGLGEGPHQNWCCRPTRCRPTRRCPTRRCPARCHQARCHQHWREANPGRRDCRQLLLSLKPKEEEQGILSWFEGTLSADGSKKKTDFQRRLFHAMSLIQNFKFRSLYCRARVLIRYSFETRILSKTYPAGMHPGDMILKRMEQYIAFSAALKRTFLTMSKLHKYIR